MPQDPLHPVAAAGTITGSANTPVGLASTMRAQLDPDQAAYFQELTIMADTGNAAPLLIGKVNKLIGEVGAANYGYALLPGMSRTYRSSFPGDSSLANLRIFSTSAWTAHVETIL